MLASVPGARPRRRRFMLPHLLPVIAAFLPAVAAADDGLRPARAADPYLAISGFYLFADDDRQVDGGLGIDAAYGWQWTDPLWLEVRATSATLDRGDGLGTDFYQYGLGADLQYAWGDRNELTPYVLVGAGASYNDIVPSRLDDWDYFANVGAGLTRSFLGFENLRWRVEGRVIHDGFLDGQVDYRVSAGLEFALRKPRPPEVREVVREVIREVVREVPVVKEVQVAAAAANPDLDGDGIVNEADKCPNTPKGAKVDATGCVIEQTLTMRDVTFETNAARLTLNGRRILDTVVAFLKAEPTVHALIEGHTDSRGTDVYNLKLSKARAVAVRDYLVAQGIASARLESAGYGESRPVASNDTDSGREMNRRVEFVLSKAK